MGTVGEKLYDFSEEEISAVRNAFPKLTLKRQGVWEGEIDIDAVHNGERIQDQFEIAITATEPYPKQMPMMFEIGGRTKATAEKYKITDPRDLHCNPKDGTACLCVKQEEKMRFPPGSNLVDFIRELVIPYLYGLSYFDKHKKWPWGEYSHGGLGLLEFYAEDPTPLTKEDIEQVAEVFRADDNWKEYSRQLRKPSAERHCICRSGKSIRKCHPRAWQGVQRLHANLTRLEINIYKLYRR